MKRNDVFQDDVNDMICTMIDSIMSEGPNSLELSDNEQDELYGVLQPVLEKFFHYPNFRSYN
jgi:hypothetical protein